LTFLLIVVRPYYNARTMQTMTEEQNIDLTHAKAQAGMQKKNRFRKGPGKIANRCER
jgi:hypothetical protein